MDSPLRINATYASTNSNQRGQGTLVESRGSFILENFAGTVKGIGVLCRCLQPDLDDI